MKTETLSKSEIKSNALYEFRQKTIFKNLANALVKENEQRLRNFVDEIQKVENLEGLKTWFYSDLLPKGKNISKFTFDELKAYLIGRKTKQTDRNIQKDLDRLQTVENAGELISVNISIEWKKSYMWGNNPNASARVHTTRGYDNFLSGSIGGCGYDKESTAVANALNQSNEILKAMYLVKEADIKANNRDLLGYGSGYGILPYLEGGVGVSCYPQIFKTIGYKFEGVAHGKTFDVYSITKL